MKLDTRKQLSKVLIYESSSSIFVIAFWSFRIWPVYLVGKKVLSQKPIISTGASNTIESGQFKLNELLDSIRNSGALKIAMSEYALQVLCVFAFGTNSSNIGLGRGRSLF